MNTKPSVVVGSALVGVAICLAAQAMYSRLSPPVALQSDWVQILSYRGVLDPSEGPVWAKVFAAFDVSPNAEDIIADNKIEVAGALGPRHFKWEGSNDFSGFRCDVLDLDGDGSKEFVFGPPADAVRVVAYREGQFSFREYGKGGDILFSGKVREIEVLDLDGDGRPEFVAFRGQTGASSQSPARQEEPSVWKWSKDQGFYEVPALLSAYRSMSGR